MKQLIILLACILSYVTTTAQQLYCQKISLAEHKIKYATVAAEKDTVLIAGFTEAHNESKAIFWVKDGATIVPDGLAQSGPNEPGKKYWGAYFAHCWWLGGDFQNSTCKYLACLSSLQSVWQSPFDVNGSINGFTIDTLSQRLIVYGDFTTVNSMLVNHIFVIDSVGQVLTLGNGLDAAVSDVEILNGSYYCIQGECSYTNTESLWRWQEGNTWEPVDMGFQFHLGCATMCKSPWRNALIVGGVLVQDQVSFYLGVMEYIPDLDSSKFITQMIGLEGLSAWGDYLFYLGVMTQVDYENTSACNLHYFYPSIDSLSEYQNDSGCVGSLSSGTTSMGHFLTPGSILGNGYTDLFFFDSIPFSVTGVHEVENAETNLVVFPNPATEVITVEHNDRDPVYIYDILGRVVVASTEREINVRTLPQGEYVIVSSTGKALFQKE